MTKSNLLKDIAAQITEALPSHVSVLKKDLEKTLHEMLIKTFTKFDLVTREEFNTQTHVLARTRKKLEELEKQIALLEERVKNKHHHT